MYMAPIIAIVVTVDYCLDARRRMGVGQRVVNVEPLHHIPESSTTVIYDERAEM